MWKRRSLPIMAHVIHLRNLHWFYLMNVFCSALSHLHFHHHTMSKLTSSIAQHQQIYTSTLCLVKFFLYNAAKWLFYSWRIPWTVWSWGHRVRSDLATFTFKTAEKKKSLFGDAYGSICKWGGVMFSLLKYSRKSNGQEKDQTRRSMLITTEAGLWAQRGSILLFFLIWDVWNFQ